MTRRELNALDVGDRVLVLVDDEDGRWEPAVLLDPQRGRVLWRGEEWDFGAHDIRAIRIESPEDADRAREVYQDPGAPADEREAARDALELAGYAVGGDDDQFGVDFDFERKERIENGEAA